MKKYSELCLAVIGFGLIGLFAREYVDAKTLNVLALGGANTQYSLTIPPKMQYRFKSRDNTVRWSNVTGKVAGSTEPYHTLAVNTWYISQLPTQAAETLYFATASASANVEYEYDSN